MKQILVILRKDCRKFWPEILLTLAITCAFVWAYPFLWASWADTPPQTWNLFRLDLPRLQILARTTTILLPVSWLILIVRLVHDENLVGTGQFWISRPIRWQSLLAEKLVFVGLFVCVPFTAAQAALLLRAGFHPTQYLPGLAYCLLLILITVVLPILVLSAVTSSLLRVIGTLLVAAIGITAVAFFCDSGPSAPSASVPYSSDRLVLPMIFVFCFGILVVQYSVRNLWLARGLVVMLLVSLVVAETNPFDVAMLKRIYDLPGPGQQYAIQAGPSAAALNGLGVENINERFAYVRIPFKLTGIPHGEVVTPDDIQVTIDGPGGAHWASTWQAISHNPITDSDPTSSFAVAVDQSFLKTLRPGAIQMAVSLGLTHIAPGKLSQVNFAADTDFALPQVGMCRQNSGFSQTLVCRVPFHQPALALFSAMESPVPCDLEHAAQPGGRPYLQWVGSELRPALSSIGFTPVWTTSITLPRSSDEKKQFDETAQIALCPGAPITVTPFHLVRRFQSQFQFTVHEIDKLPSL